LGRNIDKEKIMPLFGSTGDLKLESYNYDTKQVTDKGDVSLYLVGQNIADKPQDMAYLLSNTIAPHNPGSGFTFGYQVGSLLTQDHVTLQNNTVQFILGILAGLATESTFTDARNEPAIATAKEITHMLTHYHFHLRMPVSKLPPPK
jgi:hypothetical protein